MSRRCRPMSVSTPGVVLCVLLCAGGLHPLLRAHAQSVATDPVRAATYTRLQPLLEQRCLMCHSEQPLLPAYPAAPAGVAMDTPEQLQRFAPRVLALAVTTASMPPQNLTGMTAAERDLLRELLADALPRVAPEQESRP